MGTFNDPCHIQILFKLSCSQTWVKAQDGPVKEHDGISCHGNFEQCSKPENIQKVVEKRDSPIQKDSDVPQLNL